MRRSTATCVFAAATCEKPIDPLLGLTELGMVAANVVARAIARGVYSATALPFPGALPAWKDRFGAKRHAPLAVYRASSAGEDRAIQYSRDSCD